jgi:hypothetical protein
MYSQPKIIRIIKSKRMRLVGHKARMGEKVTGRNAREKKTTTKTNTEVGGQY